MWKWYLQNPALSFCKGFLKYLMTKGRPVKCGPSAEWHGSSTEAGYCKTWVLSALFVSDFTGKTGLQESEGPETRQSLEERTCGKADQIREYLCKLDKDKLMNPDVIDTPASRWKLAQYCWNHTSAENGLQLRYHQCERDVDTLGGSSKSPLWH